MTTRPATPRTAAPKVDLDLTALDDKPSKPLTVRITKDLVVRLIDARDLDWQISARLAGGALPFDAVVSILHPDDVDKFLAVKGITARQLTKVIEFYRSNFELTDEGEPLA